VDIAADPTHPRYASLLRRHLIETAAAEGLLAGSAMIAHGRGEAYDYLLGEATSNSAARATAEAWARMRAASRPVISVNGNTVALAGRDLLHVAAALRCPVEVNIFYRTEARMAALLGRLEAWKAEDGLDVEVLGARDDGRILGLEGPRSRCEARGIAAADVVFVPLEDGDRCEALVAMGKQVLVVDLNPLSRTARTATVTMVDDVVRVATALRDLAVGEEQPSPNEAWDNAAVLQDALDGIVAHLTSKFRGA